MYPVDPWTIGTLASSATLSALALLRAVRVL